MFSPRLTLLLLHTLTALTLADILVIGELYHPTPQARDAVADSILSISHLESTNPSVPKYALFVPLQDDNTTLITVEQYTSPAAFETHVSLPPVQSLLTLLATVNATTTLNLLSVLPDLHATEPTVPITSTWVLIQKLTFCRNETAEEVLFPAWKRVVGRVAEEGGTLMYGVYPDAEDGKRVMTVEVHESFGYFWGEQRRERAVGVVERRLRGVGAGVEGLEVRGVGGFLG
ncbi:hypothetical protein QBC39DRAFT_407083 [Podospora conica]|nr:hypothetical protein QBC39DRAFT_407083 [Schizothecium conicum]